MRAARWLAGEAFGPGAVRALALALILGVCALSCSRKASDEIVFWQFQPPEIMEGILADFRAEHPDIKVKVETLTWQSGYEKIVMAFSSGSPPDLLELGSTWFARFAGEGAIEDVTDRTSDLYPELMMWDLASYRGRRMGIPWLIGSRVLFCNQSLLRGDRAAARRSASGAGPGASAGGAPEAPETWSEMLAAARAIHDPEAGIYGFGMNAGERYVLFKKFMPFAWGNGGSVLSADLTRSEMNSAANLAALRFYLALKPYSILERQDMIDQMFKDGKIGLMLSGGWNLKRIPEDAPDLDYGVALVPRPDQGGKHASFAGAEILVFPRTGKLEPAMKLARFLVEAPQALRIASEVKSVEPASRRALEDPYYREHPMERLLLEQCETSYSPPPSPAWQEIEEVINARLEECLYGKMTPEDALATIDREINSILARSAP